MQVMIVSFVDILSENLQFEVLAHFQVESCIVDEVIVISILYEVSVSTTVQPAIINHGSSK